MNRTAHLINTPVASLQLNRHGLYRINNSRAVINVTCDKVVLWLTQTGDHRDHILLPGDRFTVNKRGRLLVEAMQVAALHIGR